MKARGFRGLEPQSLEQRMGLAEGVQVDAQGVAGLFSLVHQLANDGRADASAAVLNE